MSLHDPRTRRLARGLARTATMLCAVALGITIWGMSLSGVPRASAVPVAGVAYVVTPPGAPGGGDQPLTSGGSATAFSVKLPAASACTGDSANGGYRIQSYMAPAAVDPATLTFDAAGPVPGGLGASFQQPLFDTTGTGYVDAQTANANPAGGPGPVLNIPAFDLAVYVPGNIPAGTYNLGIACTLGPASASQLDRYWNVQLAVSTDAADVPAGITWVVVAPPATTTTTVPSTTSSATSSTTVPSSSSTSATTSSSTTSTSSTTTTSVPASSTTSTTASTTTTVPSTTTTSSTTSTTTTVPSSTTSSTSTSSTSTSTTRPSGPTTTSTASTDGSSTSTTDGTDGSTDGIFDGGTTDGTTDPTVLGGGGSPTGTSGGSPTGLPRTGSSTVALLVWAVLLIVFGRMAVLLGRPPRVIPSLRP